jgi:hypothetical protein
VGALAALAGVLSPLVLGSTPAAKLPATGVDRLAHQPDEPHGAAGAAPAPGSTGAAPVNTTTDWLARHAPSEAAALAGAVAGKIWTEREAALANGDVHALETVETGAALRIDVFHLAMVQCRCQAPFVNAPATSLQVLVPVQSRYPLDFLAAVQTDQSPMPELMVLTKATSSLPWLVSFDTESDDPRLSVASPRPISGAGTLPGVDGPAPATTDGGDLQALSDYVNAFAADGSAPASTSFGSSAGAIDVAGKFASPASGATEIPPSSYSNVASTTASDGTWSFAMTGMEPGATGLVCGTIRDTTSTEATSATPLVQNGQYGPFLPPGRYRTITQVSGIETCVISLANGSLDDFGDNVGGMSSSGR